MSKQVLNLDDVPDTKNEVVIKLDGTEHKMTALTVEDFINNSKRPDIDNPGEEFVMAVSLVSSSFPTIGEERLKKLTLPHLEAIIDFIQTANSDPEASDEDETDAEGNEQPAR